MSKSETIEFIIFCPFYHLFKDDHGEPLVISGGRDDKVCCWQVMLRANLEPTYFSKQ